MGTVHIVIIPSITGLKIGNNLTVYTATVVFLVLQADAIDKLQTLSDSLKFSYPVLFSYNY
jgi:short-subunit dehydrogenase